MDIGKNTESYDFFEKIWDIGKYSVGSSDKVFFLEAGAGILECLQNVNFKDMISPLNEFYKFIGNVPDIKELENMYNDILKSSTKDEVNKNFSQLIDLKFKDVVEQADSLIKKYDDKNLSELLEKCTMAALDNFNKNIDVFRRDKNIINVNKAKKKSR